MDDLIAFVTARLDEDEAAARATGNAVSRSNWESDGRHVFAPAKPGRFELPLTPEIDSEMADHIARHDPARVLREVEAKRAILANHDAIIAEGGPYEDQQVCTACGAYGDDWWHATGWPCATVRAIAAIWSDHPDYRQEWKPERH